MPIEKRVRRSIGGAGAKTVVAAIEIRTKQNREIWAWDLWEKTKAGSWAMRLEACTWTSASSKVECTEQNEYVQQW